MIECLSFHTSNFIPPSYLLGDMVGEGDCATVHTAYEIQSGVVVAMKCYRENSGANRSVEEQILREIGYIASQRLRHPHIVQFDAVILYEDRVFLVMEYCRNGDLLQLLSSMRPFNEDLARQFFRQLALGMEHMHRSNLVHRDLKLENLVIDSDFRLKIADFGCATTQNQNSLHGFAGSYAYAAPEVLEGRHYDGFKTDVWSMGVMLYAMVVGTLPFRHYCSIRQLLDE